MHSHNVSISPWKIRATEQFATSQSLKININSQKCNIEFSQPELTHFSINSIKAKIKDKLGIPVAEQAINIIFYCDYENFVLQDNTIVHGKNNNILLDDHTFTTQAMQALFDQRKAAVSLQCSSKYMLEHEHKRRVNEKVHSFLVQLEEGELIEFIFSDLEYNSPDFLTIFKRQLFAECGIYEDCQSLKNAGKDIEHCDFPSLQQIQVGQLEENKIIVLSINIELQYKKFYEEKRQQPIYNRDPGSKLTYVGCALDSDIYFSQQELQSQDLDLLSLYKKRVFLETCSPLDAKRFMVGISL